MSDKRIRCLLSGEDIPLTIPSGSPKPILITQGGEGLGAVLGESLADVKILKIILRRETKDGKFVADHAACIEAFRDDYVDPDE